MEKSGTNSIRLVSHAGPKSLPKAVPDEDGVLRMSLMVRDSRPINHISVARVLFKIALGSLAVGKGREAALDPRFDRARDFIRDGKFFPNRLVAVTSITPWSGCRVSGGVGAHGGTIVEIDLLGARFIIGIEPDLLVALPRPLLLGAFAFDLWDDSPGPHHFLAKKTPNEEA